MKKSRALAFLLALTVIITSLLFTYNAFADDVLWQYDDASSTLYITGRGDMDNYENETSSPWYSIILKINNIIIDDGITSIGDYSFSGAVNLKNVQISDSVKSIGAYAFSSCSSLNELTMGKNITSIADNSFAFDGNLPKQDFVINTCAGTYPLWFAVKKSIAFNCQSVTCGEYDVSIIPDASNFPSGMKACYPYTAKVNGTFKIYSTGVYDTLCSIYDSDAKLIADNDDGDVDTNFSVTVKLNKGETYYICAYIFNSRTRGQFKLFIEPVQYQVSGTVNAMLNPNGDASSIILNGAKIDNAVSDGTFIFDIDKEKAVFIEYNNASLVYTFSPDEGDYIKIPLMVCDLNNDGWVNAKDYAIMKKQAPQYLPIYQNFINYKK